MSRSGRYAKKRHGLERVFPALGRHFRRPRLGQRHAPLVVIGLTLFAIGGVSMLAFTPSSPFSVVSSNDEGVEGASPERPQSGPSPTTAPASTTTDPGPDSSVLGAEVSAEAAELVVQVVPAVRDLQVDIDGQRYSSDASGRIEAIASESEVEIEVIGYQVTPAVQQVAFTQWEDGSTSTTRTVSTEGTDRELDLGVEVRYQVIIDGGSAEGGSAVVLEDTGGDRDVDVELGEPAWVPAMAAVPSERDRLEVRTFSYDVTVEGQSVGSAPYRPTPEGLLELP